MSVSLVKLTYLLVIAFVIGTVAQLITGYHKRRIFTTFILGFIGVFAGDLIANYFHLPHILPPFFDVSLVWSVVGAVIFILAFRLIRGRW
jgi:uncharacterized membrane protein YeaQ/YmgE (transglycosylase-associated protein family)